MSLRTQLGDVRRAILRAAFRREVTLESDRPLITFSFDDFPRNALTIGGKILRDAGIRGTYFAAAGLMGKVTEVGPSFVKEDLYTLVEEGHELASHTYANVHARRMPVQDYLNEVAKGRAVLAQDWGLPVSQNFSYPFGEVTLRVKRGIGQAMRSCRGITRGLNGPAVDLNLLLANTLYGDEDRLARAETLINENARRKVWLIFYTHDVQPKPTEYGCTPKLFERVVQSAVRSGAQISTVEEVLKLAKPLKSGH
jgi:peptidoglycan/xylan/chitin deacetylase (PgdA/CDA1 family)